MKVRSQISVGATSLLLAAGLALGAAAGPAAADTSAGGTWDAPPTCFREGSQVHKHMRADGSYLMGMYQFQSEYSKIGRIESTGYEKQYIYIYEVSMPVTAIQAGPGMMTVGFAHKVCGGEWIDTTTSNIA